MRDLYNIGDWKNSISGGGEGGNTNSSGGEGSRIGEILMEAGKINLYHLSMALDIQRFQPMPSGEIFIAMKVITNEDLIQALKIQSIIRKGNGS